MKKIISIGILVMFLFSTIGVIASSYKCRMAMPVSKSCCKTNDKGCCEKNSKLLKINTDFIAVPSQLPVKSINELPVAILTSSFDIRSYLVGGISFLQDHGPPDLPVDLLLLTQSFRI
ncbi:MAG: hypothetical protein IPO83_17520 [Chitinophagaceae bacterium]|nr:hypothetical protein [Chitinophagaceae bacterium]